MIQIQPNRWSCLPTAFAMVCNRSVTDLLEKIGHDGSTILWPDLHEPKRRRGFHTQECIVALLSLGYTVTPIEYEPRLAPAAVEPLVLSSQKAIFTAYLQDTKGVVTGVVGQNGSAKGHAMAYSCGFIIDPTTGTITDGLPEGFRPTCLWIVTRL